MKIIYLTAFLIFAFPAVAASQLVNNSVCLGLDKTRAASAETILTVCNHTFGMAPVPQPRLHFRLYKDGRAELEINQRTSVWSRDENFALVTKKFKVDAGTVEEIVKLIGQQDFQNAKAVYPRFRIGYDSRTETTVYFQSAGGAKQILLNNFSVMDEENRKEYPPSLFALLRKIEELKGKN
jgi:lipopolysaccharide assembly outer membrane protein LptD (OstA)